jgi:uncharacterized membrane protein YciS (DUF1049 family)
MSEAQSAAAHAKTPPRPFLLAIGLIAVPTLYFVIGAVTAFSVESLMRALFALGVLVVVWFTRIFPLGVQDRVIRLEERVRMRRVLPADMHDRIDEIPTTLMIGLRFAADEELTELTRRVLDGELKDRTSVKNAVRSWRADHQRI